MYIKSFKVRDWYVQREYNSNVQRLSKGSKVSRKGYINDWTSQLTWNLICPPKIETVMGNELNANSVSHKFEKKESYVKTVYYMRDNFINNNDGSV